MNSQMTIVNIVLGALGGGVAVNGLMTVFDGWVTWTDGKTAQLAQDVLRGRTMMIFGGIQALGAAGITAMIIAQVNSISFTG